MPDSRNEAFFHGTDRRFVAGDTLLPSRENHGKSFPDKQYRPGVYMTQSHANAQRWAGNAAKNRGSSEANVYRVEPHGEVQSRMLPWSEGREWVAGSATVQEHVSSTEVKNPGYKEVFPGIAESARLGRAKKGRALQKHLAETTPGGVAPDTGSKLKPQAPQQVKGQRSLFGPSQVIDNNPEANRRLHVRDLLVGAQQPSLLEEHRAATERKYQSATAVALNRS